MALIKLKPTSPGRRGTVRVQSPELHKGEPYKPLLQSKRAINGRNNAGRITVRHRGGGHKRKYRIVDFRRIKDGIPAQIERLEYDPNRSAHLALLLYADGERRYILAPKGQATVKIFSQDPKRLLLRVTLCHCGIFRSVRLFIMSK